MQFCAVKVITCAICLSENPSHNEQQLRFENELVEKMTTDSNTDVTLTCKLREGVDDVKVSWYKDGKVGWSDMLWLSIRTIS